MTELQAATRMLGWDCQRHEPSVKTWFQRSKTNGVTTAGISRGREVNKEIH